MPYRGTELSEWEMGKRQLAQAKEGMVLRAALERMQAAMNARHADAQLSASQQMASSQLAAQERQNAIENQFKSVDDARMGKVAEAQIVHLTRPNPKKIPSPQEAAWEGYLKKFGGDPVLAYQAYQKDSTTPRKDTVSQWEYQVDWARKNMKPEEFNQWMRTGGRQGSNPTAEKYQFYIDLGYAPEDAVKMTAVPTDVDWDTLPPPAKKDRTNEPSPVKRSKITPVKLPSTGKVVFTDGVNFYEDLAGKKKLKVG